MGTVVEQEIYGINAERCAESAVQEINRLQNLWSTFLPLSEISAIGRYAGLRPVDVSLETALALSMAKGYHRATRGAFDITSARLSALWRDAASGGRHPSRSEIDEALSFAGSGNIAVLPGNRVFLRKKGQRVDLGGIGKGYAADICREFYIQNGIRSAMINLGGNVQVLGRKPDGLPWKVGICDPKGPRDNIIGYIEAEDCSVVTSGSYERYYEIKGKRYSHIIDPVTGGPVSTDVESATVISPSSACADALATACVVSGTGRSVELIDGIPGAEGVIIDSNGYMHVTKGLKGLVKLLK